MFTFLNYYYLCPQLALGQGVRRLHVSAAFNAKAKVSMSRFEPSNYVSYEKLNENVNIVRKRSVYPSTVYISICPRFIPCLQ